MVVRVRITIEQDEYSALLQLALAEMRNPEDQIRFLLRKELERQGLLNASQPHSVTTHKRLEDCNE